MIVFKRARNLKTGAVAFISVAFPPREGVYHNSGGQEVLKVSSFPFKEENGRTVTEFMGEIVTSGLNMPEGFQLFGSPIFVFPEETLRMMTVVNGGADEAASDGSFKTKTPEYSDLKGMAVDEVADFGMVRVVKLSEFVHHDVVKLGGSDHGDDDMDYLHSSVRAFYQSGNKRGFIVFPAPLPFMPLNRIVIPLELLHRVAKGKKIETRLSEFIEPPEEHPFHNSYGAYIWAERDGRGNVKKIVVGYDTGLFETGTVKIPWMRELASKAPDINVLAQAVSRPKSLEIFTEYNLEQFRSAMGRALGDTKGYDLLEIPLADDPFWDKTNFGGFPRLESVMWVLKFFLNREYPLAVVNEPGDTVGDAIVTRIAAGTVIFWKEPNEHRTTVPERLPAGYKRVAANVPLQVDISTWNLPSEEALLRGVGYLGRDLVPGGILIVQSSMPPAEWLGDNNGWTVISERRLEEGDYVLPARNKDGLYFIMLQKPGE